MRIITLNEDNPNEYKTYTRTFDELVGTKVSRPVFDFISFIAPETVDAAIPMITKVVGIVAVIIAIIVVLTKLL